MSSAGINANSKGPDRVLTDDMLSETEGVCVQPALVRYVEGKNLVDFI